MEVEIISTGDEVITGFITDTNVSWLCQELLSLGIQAHFRHSVGDNLEDITSLISERRKTMTNIFIERWPTDKNQTPLDLFHQFDDIRGKNTSFGKNKFFKFTFYFVLT